MEKTKKLFAYVVVFAAIVCLFAGVAMQSNLANALNSPQISIDKIYGTDGTELAAGSAKIIVPTASAEQTALKNEKAKVESGDIAPALKEVLTEIAKKSDATADYEAMVYGDPMNVELTGAAASGAVVKFDLSKYTNPVDFILFRATGASVWQLINPERAAGAANAAGDSISFRIPGSGTVMFGGFSQAKADEVKAAKEKAEEPCCKCCAKGCPFCSFLCKDGKCYCWTMYVVIALAVVFVVLLIVLIVVKSKDKKKAAAKKEEEIVADETSEDKKEETKE